MDALTDIGTFLLAASEGGGAAKEEGGSFLVSPNVGLMLWTLIAFLSAFFILRKYAYPQIDQFLERRANAIAESLDHAEQTKQEADTLLEEYRARLKEAREQADDIVARSRKAADTTRDEAKADAKQYRDELLESTRKDIEAETQRALGEIRNEVANLTIAATEKVTRKTLNEDDGRRLVEEALGEVDFSALAGGKQGSDN